MAVVNNSQQNTNSIVANAFLEYVRFHQRMPAASESSTVLPVSSAVIARESQSARIDKFRNRLTTSDEMKMEGIDEGGEKVRGLTDSRLHELDKEPPSQMGVEQQQFIAKEI